MDPNFWIERWQQNRIGFHQEEINTHLQNYWDKLSLAPGATIFVPLCGKSRDMLWLLAQGYTVVGVEISPKAVQDFFTENQLEPTVIMQGKFQRWQAGELTLLCGNYFDLIPYDLLQCNGVYDRAALIALPPDMRQKYIHHFEQIIPANSTILLITLEYEQTAMQGPPFSVTEEEVNLLYSEHYAIEPLFAADVISENARFQNEGLDRLEERVFKLVRK